LGSSSRSITGSSPLHQQLAQRGRADPLQGHRARDQAWLDADQFAAVELHFQHLVRVVDLGERQRDRRAAVADAVLAVDLLRLVQMAQGNVADGLVEQLAGRASALPMIRLRSESSEMLPPAMCAWLMAISAWSFLRFFARRDQLLVHLGDALQVVVPSAGR
jgi:hypothetical protein